MVAQNHMIRTMSAMVATARRQSTRTGIIVGGCLGPMPLATKLTPPRQVHSMSPSRSVPLWPTATVFGILLIASGADAQWVPNGAPVCIAPDSQESPQACTDGAGGVFIAWADLRNSSFTNI